MWGCWLIRVPLTGSALAKYTSARRRGLKPAQLAKLCTLPCAIVHEKTKLQIENEPESLCPKLSAIAQALLLSLIHI